MSNSLETRGIIFAYLLNPGSAKPIGWNEIEAWQPADGLLWAHLQRSDGEVRRWIRQNAQIDVHICEALLDEDSRPRSFVRGENLFLAMRSKNFEPASEPDELAALMLWFEPKRIVSVRQQQVRLLLDIEQRIRQGDDLARPGAILVALIQQINLHIAPLLHELHDSVDDLEDALLKNNKKQSSGELRNRLAWLRRQSIGLHRHLSPQHDVFHYLSHQTVEWLTETDRLYLHEESNRLVRYLSDLDTLREHMMVINEEMTALQNDQLNRTMHRLTIVTIIFLPLSFVTGLLGINVGGVPWAGNNNGFYIVSILLGILLLVEFIILYRSSKL